MRKVSEVGENQREKEIRLPGMKNGIFHLFITWKTKFLLKEIQDGEIDIGKRPGLLLKKNGLEVTDLMTTVQAPASALKSSDKFMIKLN